MLWAFLTQWELCRSFNVGKRQPTIVLGVPSLQLVYHIHSICLDGGTIEGQLNSTLSAETFSAALMCSRSRIDDAVNR